MDTGTPTRDSFDATKRYSAVRFVGEDSRDLMDWELNELQKILAYDRQQAISQIIKEGAILFELGATVAPPQPGVATGDDTAEVSGSYIGDETQTYTVSITTGGAPGTAQFDYVTDGSDTSPGPVTISAFDTPLPVGALGVYVTFSDGGDGVLNAGDSWIIPCTFGERLPEIDGNTLRVPGLRIYSRGRMEPVGGADLEYPAASSGDHFVWVERLVYKVTYDEDETLVNPDTGEPVAQREKVVCSLKVEDTSAESLPAGAEERQTWTVYRWNRETDEITRSIERYSKLNLAKLDGMLDARKILKVGMNEELKGLLARRTDDESGSYLVDGLNSFYDQELTQVRRDLDEIGPGQHVVTTAPGKAYIRGVEIDSPGEEKDLSVATDYDAVQNEPHTYEHGLEHLEPLRCQPGEGNNPLESITSLSGPVLIASNVTRGAIPGGADVVPSTPLQEILAVTAAPGVGGASRATLLAPTTGPYVIEPRVAGDAFIDDDPYLLEIEVSDYVHPTAKQTLKFHLSGSPAEGWTVDQICDALNKGRGLAYWKYANDTGPHNVVFENDGGQLRVSTLATGGWQTVKIVEDCPLASCFGWSGGEEGSGSGVSYIAGSDYVKSGNRISWSPAGSEPSTGTQYQVIYTYIRNFVAEDDYIIGGHLGDNGGHKQYYYAVTAGHRNFLGEETEVSNVRLVQTDAAARIRWRHVTGATHYNVYRGETADDLKLIARTHRQYYGDSGDFEGVIDYPYSETIEGGRVIPSYKMSEILWAWSVYRRTVSFKTDSGIIPHIGGTLSLTYQFHLPRFILRVIGLGGVIEDIIGDSEENPRVPLVPASSIPLCAILQRLYQDPIVYNYQNYRITMQGLQRMVRHLREVQDGLAEQQSLNEALLGESANINGIFVDRFIDTGKMDEAHPDHACRIRSKEGVVTLPQTVKQFPLEIVDTSETGLTTTAKIRTRYAMIDYNPKLFISQGQWSSFKRVNPYVLAEVPRIRVSPRETDWINEGALAEAEITQRDIATRGEGIETKLVSRPITIEGWGFSAGKEVRVKFAGRLVNLSPAPDSGIVAGPGGSVIASAAGPETPGGWFRASCVIPDSVTKQIPSDGPWSTKTEISAYDEDDHIARSYYINQGDPVAPSDPEITADLDEGIDGDQVGPKVLDFAESSKSDIISNNVEICRERTDPIAQTIANQDYQGFPVFIDKLVLPMPAPEQVIPMGTVLDVVIRNCELGIPSAEVVARALMTWYGPEPSPGFENSYRGLWLPGSNNHVRFDDPVLFPSLYGAEAGISRPIPGMFSHKPELAICLYSNSPYVRAFIARMGEQGQNPVRTIETQPYLPGVLLSSADGASWTPHQDADLRFQLYRCEFLINAFRGRLVFDTIAEANVTEIELVAPSFLPTSGCKINWRYQVSTGVMRQQFGLEPNQPVRFRNPQSAFILQGVMTSDDDRVSPLVAHEALELITRSNKPSGGYVTKTNVLAQDFDGARVKVELKTPGGSSQELYISNDGGETWNQLTSGHFVGSTLLDNGFVDMTYDFSDFGGADRRFKFKLIQNAGILTEAPEARNLRIVTYSV